MKSSWFQLFVVLKYCLKFYKIKCLKYMRGTPRIILLIYYYNKHYRFRELNRWASQMFCNISVKEEKLGSFFFYLTVRYRPQLILSECYSQDLFWWREYSHGIYCFRLTRPYLIVVILATRTKSLEPSGHCTLIKCAFIFCTTNILPIQLDGAVEYTDCFSAEG